MAATEKKPPRPKPNHPTFLQMAKEAIISLGERDGSSVQKIRNTIAETYKLETDFVRIHLKPALAKGLENEIFVRPKNSDVKGYTGRFKINKAKATEEAKKLKEKEKEKAKVVKKSSKSSPKKAAAKTATKKTTKSPKKTATAKAKTAKSTTGSKAKPKTTATKTKTAKKALLGKLKTPKKTPKTPKASK